MLERVDNVVPFRKDKSWGNARFEDDWKAFLNQLPKDELEKWNSLPLEDWMPQKTKDGGYLVYQKLFLKFNEYCFEKGIFYI